MHSADNGRAMSCCGRKHSLDAREKLAAARLGLCRLSHLEEVACHDDPTHQRTDDFAMMNLDAECHVGETMAEVLRERLVELETLEATGVSTEETVGRLAYVRKLLIRFDARDTSTATRPA